MRERSGVGAGSPFAALVAVAGHGGGMRRRQRRGDAEPAAAELPGGPMMQTLGEGEGEVNLIAWAGYVEDGSTDPKVDWVTDFEQETGCKVNVKIGNTSDEMVTLMRTGKYDGVSASGDATLRLIAAGDVAPVNTDLIPNYADVFAGLKDQPLQQRGRPDVRRPARPRREPAHVAARTTVTPATPTAGASSGTRTRPTRARSRRTTARSTSRTPRST